MAGRLQGAVASKEWRVYPIMMSKQFPPLLRVWLCVTWLLAWPLTGASWIAHRRMGADPRRFRERLGHGAPVAAGSGRVLWFHAASLGEVTQIAPLADDLARREQAQILVTTTTATGAAWVAAHMPRAEHRFVPLDTPRATRRFLDGWSPAVAIFVEGDLWPRLLVELSACDIPQVLLNARHSRTRARLSGVFGALLPRFQLVTCRSAAVSDGIKTLGVAPDRVHVLPDLRVTLPALPAPEATIVDLSKAIGARPVWLAASTHIADEAAVLEAHRRVLEHTPDALLILAPRHPKRGQPLVQAARACTFTVARRSVGTPITPQTQVYVADTLGELGLFYSLSPIAFLGGSFGSEGGHNPYEPARFDTAIVAGANVKNFVDAYDALAQAGAAVQITDPQMLGEEIADLLQGARAHHMGQAGRAYMAAAGDCTAQCAALIAAVLKPC